MTCTPDVAATWSLLARAIRERRSVRADYHGRDRLLCPHQLGWRHGRPMLVAYQAGGTTSSGVLPSEPGQRWRTLFVDEVRHAVIDPEQPWQTAGNYRPHPSPLDEVAVAVDLD